MRALSAAPSRRRRNISSFGARSEEHTSELQSRVDLVCRLLLEKKKKKQKSAYHKGKSKPTPTIHQRQSRARPLTQQQRHTVRTKKPHTSAPHIDTHSPTQKQHQ